MQDTKIWILGIAAGVGMTMAIIAAMNAYVTQVHTSAPRTVLHLEPVTVTGDRKPSQPASFAETHEKAPASL